MKCMRRFVLAPSEVWFLARDLRRKAYGGGTINMNLPLPYVVSSFSSIRLRSSHSLLHITSLRFCRSSFSSSVT